MIYVLMLCLHIIVTVCFLKVHGQGTPVLTIAQSPVTVGDGDQYTELKCQINKSSEYLVSTHRIQRQRADSSYTLIATIDFSTPANTVVNYVPLRSRASATQNDPSGSSVTFFAGSLQIRDVICTDASMYRCETRVLNVINGRAFFHHSTGVELETIKLPSENPTLSNPPTEINAADDVQFACNGNVGRPPVELTIGVSIGSLSLELLPLTGVEDLSQAGDDCTQNRRVTAGRTFTREEAISGVIAQCNVAGYASLVHQQALDIKYYVGDLEIAIDHSHNQSREILEGSPMEIRCTSQANPPAHHVISFIREGDTEITEEWTHNIVVFGSLEKSDAGTYFCSAFNTLSTVNFTASSQNITLTVTEQPPTEAPTTPVTDLPTEPTTQLHGNTEPESSVNVAAVAAGVIVPIVIIIVVLVAIICVYRRRQDALKDILIQRQTSNDSIIPDPSSYPARDVTASPIENGHYEEIKDTGLGLVADDYVIAQNDTPGARHNIRPTTLPDLTSDSSSEPRSNCYDNAALEYEMTSVGTGDSQYVNIDSETKVRVYDRLTSVPVITHSPSPTESPYVNKMVENRGTYENV